MAKYCIKCGKALPEGVEICPDCNALGQSESDAALFTMLTSSAEVWRESEEEKEKKLRRAENFRKNQNKIIIASCAGALALIIVFVVLFTLPISRVIRAVNNDEYDKALAIWSEKLSDDEVSSRTEDKLLSAAERVLASLAVREITNGEAEEAMDSLYSFGPFTKTLFADVQKEMDKLFESSANMALGGEYFSNGDYLAACDSYRLVSEADALYEEAQTKAAECLEAYAATVIEDANVLVAENEYTAAIECLKTGDGVLNSYGTFSEAIDAKIEDCYRLYESYVLITAQALAETEDYVSARETVRLCVEDYGYSTDALLEALEQYSSLADKQLVTNTLVSAENLYNAGKYAEVFETLEAILDKVSGEYITQAEDAIVEFETRFAEDTCTKAEEKYDGDRKAVAGAIADLEAALAIREVEAIEDMIEALEPFLPLDLVSDPYSERVGEVTRNSSEFVVMDGVKYHKWMWGRDESNIEFELNAEYDVFEAVFALRGSKDDKKSAYFEVFLDGEKVYTSDTLHSDSEEPVILIEVDVTGAKLMKIVFHCDYEASPGHNGYSNHAICLPEVYKEDK